MLIVVRPGGSGFQLAWARAFINAARVVAGQTDCASECADAVDLLRKLDRRPLHAIAAAAFPNAGAA